MAFYQILRNTTGTAWEYVLTGLTTELLPLPEDCSITGRKASGNTFIRMVGLLQWRYMSGASLLIKPIMMKKENNLKIPATQTGKPYLKVEKRNGKNSY